MESDASGVTRPGVRVLTEGEIGAPVALDSCMNSQRNRKRIPAVLLCLLLPVLIVTGCNRGEIESHWAGEAITIDGDMSDWPDSTRTYLKKEKALVGISNDGENLYLLFRFGEPAWLTAMAMGDLTVWVDTTGKRTRDLGFRYSGGIDPAGAMSTPAGRAPSGGRRPTGGDRPGQRPGGTRTIEPPALQVVREDAVVGVSLNGADGPSARSSMIDRMFTLELRIPLNVQPGDAYGIDIGPGESVLLGFELAIDKDQIGEMGRGGISVGMPGGGTGGRGGGMGGGMGGGRGGGRAGGMGGGPGGMTLPQEQKIWVQTMLAEPPR